MTIPEIEAFLAVVKYGNISAAAENLFVTQPALTRRIKTLEAELGYSLFKRGQGCRYAQLTEHGTEFSVLAKKWQRLLQETESIKSDGNCMSLSIAAIDSLNHNILVPVFSTLIQEGYHLLLHHTLSEETYEHMERGLYDVVFFTQQEYTRQQPRDVIVLPLFSESFGIASAEELPNKDGVVDIRVLKEENEILLPWSKEFASWHTVHFDESIRPRLSLEHAILSQYYMVDGAWTFIPYTSFGRYRDIGCRIYTMQDMPPELLISCAYNRTHKTAAINYLLTILKRDLLKLPADRIHLHSISAV